MPERARKGNEGEAPVLGILAGGGALPCEIAQAAIAAGRPVHIVALDGFADPVLTAFPHERVSLGQVGRILRSFRRAGAGEMVIAGSIRRPDLLRLRVDLGFFRHLPTVLRLTRGGDDSVLRRVVRFFEGQGFRVLGVGEVAPHLLATAGPLGTRVPTANEADAIRRAGRLIAALGTFDVGQAVVVRAGAVIGVESVRGTDALLRDLGPGGFAARAGAGGVLVKIAKPGQERRVDLPTVGLETVRLAAVAGLAGIAVGAGDSIVLDRAETLRAAEREGLFVFGATAEPAAAAAEAMPVPTPVSTVAPVVLGRHAPTPADRRDIGLGRRLLPVLAAHGAGHAVVITGEHVLAVEGAMPLDQVVASVGQGSSWGRRAFRKRLGVLVIDAADGRGDAVCTIDLFRAAAGAGLAGLALVGGRPGADVADAVVGWANDARMFLLVDGVPA